jgi:hypothetical protein
VDIAFATRVRILKTTRPFVLFQLIHIASQCKRRNGKYIYAAQLA